MGGAGWHYLLDSPTPTACRSDAHDIEVVVAHGEVLKRMEHIVRVVLENQRIWDRTGIWRRGLRRWIVRVDWRDARDRRARTSVSDKSKPHEYPSFLGLVWPDEARGWTSASGGGFDGRGRQRSHPSHLVDKRHVVAQIPPGIDETGCRHHRCCMSSGVIGHGATTPVSATKPYRSIVL